MHQQRREARQAPGADPAQLQGRHQVPDRDDEAWLHRRVRDRRRPPVRQGRGQPDRSPQQGRHHLAPVRREAARHRAVDQHAAALASVRVSFEGQRRKKWGVMFLFTFLEWRSSTVRVRLGVSPCGHSGSAVTPNVDPSLASLQKN